MELTHFYHPFHHKNSISTMFQAAAEVQRRFREFRALSRLFTNPRWVPRRKRASPCCWRHCTNAAGTLPRSSTHQSLPEPGPLPPEREGRTHDETWTIWEEYRDATWSQKLKLKKISYLQDISKHIKNNAKREVKKLRFQRKLWEMHYFDILQRVRLKEYQFYLCAKLS